MFFLEPGETFLNCAYMSPMPESVAAAGREAIGRKAQPYRISLRDFFEPVEALRAAFAQLCKFQDPAGVAIIPSVSYGMATVAKNFNPAKGTHIIVAGSQFPSNVYPWMELAKSAGAEVRIIEPPEVREGRGKEWNVRILEAIGPGTAMVAIGHVHWADGTRFDLEAIRRRTSEVGALLVIDGTQSVGAMPFDARTIGPDALVCAGYKWLMGPYTTGLAWYGDRFAAGQPLEHNWINRLNSEDFAGLTQYEDRFQPGMRRYDMGEKSNFIQVPMMLEALRFINSLGAMAIQDHTARITANAIDRLKENGWWVEDPEWRGSHLIGLLPPEGRKAEEWKQNLLQARIHVSFRGAFIRVSPHLYNTEEDMHRLQQVLTAG